MVPARGIRLPSSKLLPIAVLVAVMIAARAYAMATRRTDPKQWREQLSTDVIWIAAIFGLYYMDEFVWRRQQYTATQSAFLWALIAATPALLIGPRLIRWAFRDRWAGPLLLELPRFHRKLFTGIFAVAVPLPVLLSAAAITSPVVWMVSELSLFSIVFDLFILAGRLQLRQQGIVQSGQLVRWANVASCIFDENTRLLKIKTTRPARPDYAIAASPDREMNIYIPFSLARQVEAVLRSHLPQRIVPRGSAWIPASG